MMKANIFYNPTPSVLTIYGLQLNTAFYLAIAALSAAVIIENSIRIFVVLCILCWGGMCIPSTVALIKYRHAYMLPKVQVYYAIFANVICIASVLISVIYFLGSLL